MKIREYRKGDIEKIQDICLSSFEDSEKEEIKILSINMLQDDDIYCFVAEEKEELLGFVIFSKIEIDNSNVLGYILSPLAVVKNYHKKGIGSNLVKKRFETLKENNVGIAITYGNPNYYKVWV